MKTVKIPATAARAAPLMDVYRFAYEEDNPYFCRLSLDKRHQEVGRALNRDWREVISDDQVILERFHWSNEEDACAYYNDLRHAWAWRAFLRAARKVLK